MRHLLGAFAVLLSLAGCGEDDPAEPDVRDHGSADPVLVHATAGRGEPATAATELPGEAAVAAYAEQFADVLAARVRRAADEVVVGDGEVLAAQVVAIGCDVPPGATYHDGRFVPAKVVSPLPECFAPVTTVALAAVAAS